MSDDVISRCEIFHCEMTNYVSARAESCSQNDTFSVKVSVSFYQDKYPIFATNQIWRVATLRSLGTPSARTSINLIVPYRCTFDRLAYELFCKVFWRHFFRFLFLKNMHKNMNRGWRLIFSFKQTSSDHATMTNDGFFLFTSQVIHSYCKLVIKIFYQKSTWTKTSVLYLMVAADHQGTT